jgi:hypothetical protein
METVTSFSASLLQSLGGDTAEAARMANMAIIDMSDNANKMGTDMSSIQTAYQGFAKQNFTMLDNLKLGYGGTKQEMERLLERAEEIKASQGELAEYSVESFGDIVEAIHVVQDEMGITGTTAKEAGETVAGSISSMKAAWQNLINNLGNDKADLGKLIDDFFEKAENAWDKLAPVALKVLDGMIEMFIEGLPKFLEIGVKIGETIVEGILSIIMKPIAGLMNATGITDFVTAGTGARHRASGGPVSAGIPYMTGELGPELFVPATNGYVFDHNETEDILSNSGGITIQIQGDIYDDERSMRQKMKSAILGVLQEQVAYG